MTTRPVEAGDVFAQFLHTHPEERKLVEDKLETLRQTLQAKALAELKLTAFSSEYDTLMAQFRKMEKHWADDREKLQRTSSQVANLEEQRTQLEQQVADKTREIEDLTAQVASLGTQVKEQMQRLDEVIASREELRGQAARLQAEVHQLFRDLEAETTRANTERLARLEAERLTATKQIHVEQLQLAEVQRQEAAQRQLMNELSELLTRREVLLARAAEYERAKAAGFLGTVSAWFGNPTYALNDTLQAFGSLGVDITPVPNPAALEGVEIAQIDLQIAAVRQKLGETPAPSALPTSSPSKAARTAIDNGSWWVRPYLANSGSKGT